MSSKSSFGALEDVGSSSLGFGISILIWIWSLVSDTPMIRILALYLDFEDAKNIHVLQVIIWGFGECWRFLTGVWHFDLDFDMVTGFLYTKFWLSILILKVQRTCMSFKSSFGALEDTGGS